MTTVLAKKDDTLTLPMQRIPLSVQGSIHWYFLQMYAYNYPDHPTPEDQRVAKEFVTNTLVNILGPTCSCREHMLQYIGLFPVDVSSRVSFFIWTVNFHNAVSARLGKPQYTLLEAAKMYQRLSESQSIEVIPLPKDSKLLYVMFGNEWYSMIKASGATLSALFVMFVIYRMVFAKRE